MDTAEIIRRIEAARRDMDKGNIGKARGNLANLLEALRDPFSQPLSSFEIKGEGRPA